MIATPLAHNAYLPLPSQRYRKVKVSPFTQGTAFQMERCSWSLVCIYNPSTLEARGLQVGGLCNLKKTEREGREEGRKKEFKRNAKGLNFL